MTRNDEMACFVSVDSREEKLTALSKEIWEYQGKEIFRCDCKVP